jgi:ABC-2 type transport system ATP-binding protein
MTGLGDFQKRLAGRLSGGMKQKLGLACTLIHPPRLLLLDEATVGVDPVSRRELWAIVTRLSKDKGMTVLLSTAYLDEAERCGETILLHQGEILGKGSPEEFSGPLEGRTFAISVPLETRRRAQQVLSGTPGVVDAVISGSGVRLLTEKESQPNLRELLPDFEGAEVRPVRPRFEDGYVAILHQQISGRRSPEHQVSADGGTTDTSEAAIEVDDVKRRFGDFYAVKGISFSVKKGEVFGLLGANGAGKSTTFRMLCGLLPSSGGSVRVAGLDLRHSRADARGRVGYMSQHFSLYGNLNVDQNLRFFSSVYGLKGKDRARRIAWAHDEFQLGEVAEATSADLPLGYKQRLALACALMHEPEIIFLDEPTSGVDPLARREFWQQINTLAEKGVTVLVTTHFMEEAEYCDRLAIMSAGEILDLGTPEEIKSKAGSAEEGVSSMEDAFIALIEDRASGERMP